MNSQSRVAVIWFAIGVVAIAGIFLPGRMGVEMMPTGFAIALVSFALLIVAVVAAIVYWRRSVALEAIIDGKGLLAHWRYDSTAWARHLEDQFADSSKRNRSALVLLAAISAGIGLLFLILDPDAGRYVLLAMVALIVLSAVVAFISPWLQRRNNAGAKPEAYVAARGAVVGNDLHIWRIMGTRLDDAVVEAGTQQHLVITYSAATRTGRQEYVVRIPVPPGEEASAAQAAAALRRRDGT